MTHKGMLTKVEDFYVGRVVWHVYGHFDNEPEQYVLTHEPVTTAKMDEIEDKGIDPIDEGHPLADRMWAKKKSTDPKREYDHWFSLGDVGVGHNHNRNRMFETREDALAYWSSPEVVAYREMKINRDDDYWLYVFDEDFPDPIDEEV